MPEEEMPKEEKHREHYMLSFFPGKHKTFEDVQNYLATLPEKERKEIIREINLKIALKQEMQRFAKKEK